MADVQGGGLGTGLGVYRLGATPQLAKMIIKGNSDRIN